MQCLNRISKNQRTYLSVSTATQQSNLQRDFKSDGIHRSRDTTAVLTLDMKRTIDTICNASRRSQEQGFRHRNTGIKHRTVGSYRDHQRTNRSLYGHPENSYTKRQMNTFQKKRPLPKDWTWRDLKLVYFTTLMWLRYSIQKKTLTRFQNGLNVFDALRRLVPEIIVMSIMRTY